MVRRIGVCRPGARTVPNADLIHNVRICEGQVGDDVFGDEEPFEHWFMNEAAFWLEVGAYGSNPAVSAPRWRNL